MIRDKRLLMIEVRYLKNTNEEIKYTINKITLLNY